MSTTTLTISDMHCGACEAKIRQVLKPIGEIAKLQFNPVRRQVLISHVEDLKISDLLLRIENIGFTPMLDRQTSKAQEADGLLKRLGIAGLGMMQVMMVQIALYAGFFQGMDESIRRLLELTALFFTIPVVAYAAMPFFVRGLGFAKSGLNMDTPIALAIGVAFITSLLHTMQGFGEVYYDSVVMFTFLMLASRFIERRVRTGLVVDTDIENMLPRVVIRMVSGRLERTELSSICIDDRLWVSEGQTIAADGVVDEGIATLDESWLSGESDWLTHPVGDEILAGSVSRGAGFVLLVTHKPSASRMAKISRLADADMAVKHKGVRLADKVARVFIPCIIALAGLTYLVWFFVDSTQALRNALAVLIVSCPCALSLAVPTAITAALSSLRRSGIYLPQARTLEIVNRVKQVFFDKTGTLTSPQPTIKKVEIVGVHDKDDCLAYATALQAHSSHVLARAFQTERIVPAVDVQLDQGGGVQGCVNGHLCRIGSANYCGVITTDGEVGKAVWLSVDGLAAAKYSVSNELRVDAQSTVRALEALGIDVHILSGDKAEHCARVAGELNVDFQAGQSPEAKSARMRQSKETGSTMFIGDGVNDLPALATADVSVATLETVDLVRSKADVLLLTQRLSSLVNLVEIGRRCHQIIWQNMGWALCYNLIAIPSAAFGYIPPWMAALGMSVSSLAVMLNASRLLHYRVRAAK